MKGVLNIMIKKFDQPITVSFGVNLITGEVNKTTMYSQDQLQQFCQGLSGNYNKNVIGIFELKDGKWNELARGKSQ